MTTSDSQVGITPEVPTPPPLLSGPALKFHGAETSTNDPNKTYGGRHEPSDWTSVPGITQTSFLSASVLLALFNNVLRRSSTTLTPLPLPSPHISSRNPSVSPSTTTDLYRDYLLLLWRLSSRTL